MREPVELVKIAIPVLAEACAVVLFICACTVWIGVLAGGL